MTYRESGSRWFHGFNTFEGRAEFRKEKAKKSAVVSVSYLDETDSAGYDALLEKHEKGEIAFLSDILTPEFDPHSKTRYRGNHADLVVRFRREGDVILLQQSFGKNEKGGFSNFIERQFTLKEVLGLLNKQEVETLLIDDIPEGVSLAG